MEVFVKKILTAFFTLFCVLAFTSNALCQDTRSITLKDGSLIQGKVLSVSDNVYTLETAFGQVQINGDDITSIAQSTGPTSTASSPALSPDKIQKYQQQVMQDPAIMNDLQALAQDEQMIKMLSDPELMNLLLSGDTERIQSHPKFQELLKDPRVQSLIQKTSQRITIE